MTMSFGSRPPEVNSGLMSAGPGSGPMMAVASAWGRLAAELRTAAGAYETVVMELSGEEWLGLASEAMVGAVAPYVAWMNATAAHAEQAASQAKAAAAAYEAAFAAMVPPPMIATNRVQLEQAVMTNVFGQNTATIAALEAQYGAMWAQDAATMYNYAGTSATAVAVSPFTAPPQIVNPSAVGSQAAAAGQSTPAGSVQQTLNQVLSNIPATLNKLASPLLGSQDGGKHPLSWLWQILFGTTTFPSSLQALLTAYGPFATFFYNTEGLPYFSSGMANNFVQSAKTLGMIGGAAPAAAAEGAAKGLGSLGATLGGGGGGTVAAGLGNAASVGKLSVPPVWNGQLPGVHPGAAPLPVSTVSAAPDAGAGNLLGGMPLAGMGAGAAGSGPRYGFRPTVMARPPFAG